MYGWLTDALAGGGTVITANRRLARLSRQEFARRMIARGELAWRSPRILAWPDWLDAVMQEAVGQEMLPTRINRHHSGLLWDRCLRKELPPDATGVGNLVRLAQDTWQRLADWGVTIRDVARQAQSADHRMFAVAAGRYAGLLEREGWVDEAGLADLVCRLLDAGSIIAAGRFTFAGFDRRKPIVERARQCLRAQGCEVADQRGSRSSPGPVLVALDDHDAELRAAGAWARRHLELAPGRRIGIVVKGLERDAERCAGLVREGLLPGYRFSPDGPAEALNVSFGRQLADYPAVSSALLWLRWLARDLGALDVSHLLRTPLVGVGPIAGRARLELRLRGMADRAWSTSMITSSLRGTEAAPDAEDWLRRVAALTRLRRELPGTASPAAWAVRFDAVLEAAGWPGQEPLDSDDFQLVNRWRELLNDFARLDLVSPRMSLATALAQLEGMAGESVFQPESEAAQVHLLGALEALGLEFDAVWVAGLTATEWPPHGNPSLLISRRLQEAHGMPDATPADTLEYATSLLMQVCASAPDVVCSYPQQLDDAEQSPSELLQAIGCALAPAPPTDPGWHAARLAGSARSVTVADRVPAVAGEERLTGGASTLQNQLADPVRAFIGGRLGVRPLDQQATGLQALLRGTLVHDALYRLYLDRPSRDELAAWRDVPERIAVAVDAAFARHERDADTVLRELLARERRRVARLLRAFLAADAGREPFGVEAVERELVLAEAGLLIELRIDRIDRLADGRIAIIDYKTGAEKRFFDASGAPREIQLVAYACAVEEPVAALVLANIDTRVVGFDGAGQGFADIADWDLRLEEWSHRVRDACRGIARGDVRINIRQTIEEARPLNLLTRFTELRHAR